MPLGQRIRKARHGDSNEIRERKTIRTVPVDTEEI